MTGKTAYISSKAVIAKVMNDYKLSTDSWIGSAYQWIGEALGIMQHVGNTELVSKECNIVDYKVVLPCCADSIEFFEYDCCYYPINNVTRLQKNCTANKRSQHYGFINGKVLQTHVQTGTITIHYKRVMVGDDDLPLIPNDDFVLQAAAWYVLRGYLMQGNTHPVITWKMADEMWEKYYPRAINSVNFPSPLEQESFKNMWVNMIPQIRQHYAGHVNSHASVDNSNINSHTGGSFNLLINNQD